MDAFTKHFRSVLLVLIFDGKVRCDTSRAATMCPVFYEHESETVWGCDADVFNQLSFKTITELDSYLIDCIRVEAIGELFL